VSYRTLISLAATAIVGMACVSTDAFAAYRGVRGGVYHGGVHRGAYVRPGVGIGVRPGVGVGAAAVGAAAVGAAAYDVSIAGAAYGAYQPSNYGYHYTAGCGYYPYNDFFGHIGLPGTWNPC
jgi:hypothetical protein